MSMERVTELVDELALEVMFRLRGDEGAAELDEERLKANRAKIEEFRSELQAFIARRNSLAIFTQPLQLYGCDVPKNPDLDYLKNMDTCTCGKRFCKKHNLNYCVSCGAKL
jgi:hypothetical protein